MATEHPFQQLFESFGRLPASHAETVNLKAYQELTAALDSPVASPGRCILLRAPRAGHGKTHLLSRAQHHLGGTHEFIPLHASGSRVDSLSVTEDALKRLVRALPAAGGLTVLDLVIRRLFAFSLQPLVVSGEVPCQDREGALAALKSRPVETFDFHHPNAVTAHWARDNFEVLGPRLSMELAQRSGVPIREVSFWVSAFFRYASTPLDHPGRAGALGLEVAGEAMTEGVAMERLFALLAMLSQLMRVVLVADDLEGFSADESSALKFAAFVGAIRQSADRVDVIVSLNKDVWENAFVPRLSGGLADRLSEILIELEPLTDEDIVALFDSRAPGLGRQVLDRVDVSERHARGLIRSAGAAWLKAASETTHTPPVPAAPPVFEAVASPAVEHEVEPAAVSEFSGVSEVEHEPLASEDAPDIAPADYFPPSEFSSPPVFQAVEPVEASAPEPPFEPYFTPVFDEPQSTPQPVETFETQPQTPPQWGPPAYVAPVFEPLSEPQEFQQPVDFEAEESPFQPVISQDVPPQYTAVFSPQGHEEPFQVQRESPAPFETVTPSANFASFAENTPALDPVKDGGEDADRVDDLLKQFRERYGR